MTTTTALTMSEAEEIALDARADRARWAQDNREDETTTADDPVDVVAIPLF